MSGSANADATRKRSGVWALLDNPVLWEVSRVGLDLGFGLYRRRLALMRDWGVLDGAPSVLDIGCGIGQYASITTGRYVGVDLNGRYIAHARRRRGGPSREFRELDVTTMDGPADRFDLVVMVDFLHHLDAGQCERLLRAAARLSAGSVISFEPLSEQRNRAGRWIVDHDRGDHTRPLAELEALFAATGLEQARAGDLMLGPIRTRAILARPSRT